MGTGIPPKNPYHPSVLPWQESVHQRVGNSESTAAAGAVSRQVLAAAVARPHQAVLLVVAEGLVLAERAAARRGYSGRQLQHVTHVVVGAPLAPDGADPFGSAGRLRALDAVMTYVGETFGKLRRWRR